jgi:hypothetical protein
MSSTMIPRLAASSAGRRIRDSPTNRPWPAARPGASTDSPWCIATGTTRDSSTAATRLAALPSDSVAYWDYMAPATPLPAATALRRRSRRRRCSSSARERPIRNERPAIARPPSTSSVRSPGRLSGRRHPERGDPSARRRIETGGDGGGRLPHLRRLILPRALLRYRRGVPAI